MERELILERLLDKYENSKHLLQPGCSTRRVMLRTEKRELPEYQYENATVRDAYNAAARALEKENLVCLEWTPNRSVLAIISLNLQEVLRAYQMVGRIHPQKKAEQVCALLKENLAGMRTGWIAAWGRDVQATAADTFRLPAYCAQGLTFFKELVIVFLRFDALQGQAITMRAFSTLCFQNSKRFEREFREEFLRIARRYDGDLAELCNREKPGMRDQLAYLGIYARPELYELSGQCALLTQKGRLEISALFPHGLAIPSTAVDELIGFDLHDIQKIVFIENKTNYDAYLQTELTPEQMVIYHGGFLSPQKRKLVQKLAACIPDNVTVVFWADIDLGGFQMFSHLQALLPALKPMRMSAEDVKRYAKYGLERPQAYLNHLKELWQAGAFPLFEGAIRQILQCRVTIEQEIFLTEEQGDTTDEKGHRGNDFGDPQRTFLDLPNDT